MKKQLFLFTWPPPLPVRTKRQPVDPEELARAVAFIEELENDLRQHILDSQPSLPFPEPPELPALSLEERLDRTVKELGRHSITEIVRAARHRARTHPPILKGPIIE